MFERFTEQAINVIILAQEESRRRSHNYVGTEQILLGLIAEGDAIAAQVIDLMGITLKDARIEADKLVELGNQIVEEAIPFTPRAKRILELSLQEAHELGHAYIGTEHLLLGLIREGEGVGCRILEILGVNFARVRIQIIRMLDKTAKVSRKNLSSKFPFSKFTKKSIQCLLVSSQEAFNFRQREVSLELIFLSLLKEKTSPAGKSLNSMGITVENAISTITKATYTFTLEELKISEDLNLNLNILNNRLRKIFLDKENAKRRQDIHGTSELQAEITELKQQFRAIQKSALQEISEASVHLLFTKSEQLNLITRAKNDAAIKQDWDGSYKLLNQEIEIKQQIRALQNNSAQEMLESSAHLSVGEVSKIKFSEESVNALESAVREAQDLNHNHVTPEHILLGLLDTGGVKFVDFLEELGVHALSLRKRLVNILQGEAYTSRDANVYIENFANHGEFMSEKSINFTAGNISGSVVNLGEINGNVTNTINQLSDSQSPNKSELADLLTQLQSAVNSEDSGLDDKDKAKALKHIESIGKLGSKQNDATLREKAEDALDALIGIGGKFASFFGIAKPLIDSVKSILNL